jgi:hypothetical protein
LPSGKKRMLIGPEVADDLVVIHPQIVPEAMTRG